MDYNNNDNQQTSYSSQEEAMRAAAAPERDEHSGLPTASLILGIISIVGIFCWLDVITAPIALILGGVALAKKYGNKGLAITGVVLSVLSLLVSVFMLISVLPIIRHSEEIVRDYAQLVYDQDEVFPAYEKDKSLPPYLAKYNESPYSDYLNKYAIDIYKIMDLLDEEYQKGNFTKPEDLGDMVIPSETADGAAAVSSSGILVFE